MFASLTPILAGYTLLAEEGEHEVHAGDGGWLAEWAWLIRRMALIVGAPA